MNSESSIEVIHSPVALRALTRGARRDGQIVALVPTMGALHLGHLSLIEEARRRADLVVVSIFVNPTQFGPNEDFEQYPRDLERDVAECSKVGASVVYAPDVHAMYPEGHCTVVHLEGITEPLCGAHRPGHFDGVATIVTKLFNQVGPCVAVFGRKDFQQFKVITQMVRDLDLEVDVVGAPTVREPDGMALSSRNVYLSADERARALSIVRGLSAAWNLVDRASEPVTAADVRETVTEPVRQKLDSIDYVEVCEPETLDVLADDVCIMRPTLVAVAGRLGSTRLIDNVVLKEEPDPLARD
jgi:pantoate--beta-alanine ligase